MSWEKQVEVVAAKPQVECEICGEVTHLPHCTECGEHHDPHRISCGELAEIRAAEHKAWDSSP